jgi:hypothetical protein
MSALATDTVRLVDLFSDVRREAGLVRRDIRAQRERRNIVFTAVLPAKRNRLAREQGVEALAERVAHR